MRRRTEPLSPAARELLVRLAKIWPGSLRLDRRSAPTIQQLLRCSLVEIVALSSLWDHTIARPAERTVVRLRGRLPAHRRDR